MPKPAEAAPGVAPDGRVSFGDWWTDTNGTSGPLGMSDDGRFIVFYSYGNNLTYDDWNAQGDVYRYDMLLGITLLVSISDATWLAGDGTVGDTVHRSRMVSPDGRYVMFSSSSTDLVTGDTNEATDVFVRDMNDWGLTKRVSLNNGNQIAGDSVALGMSNDALKLLFATEVSLTASDTNETWDVYLYDRTTGVNKTKLVSANAAGAAVGSGLGVTSETGRYVAFLTEGALNAADTNLENDVYLKDLSTPAAAPKWVSAGMGGAAAQGFAGQLTMTPDAKFVAFESSAANIVSGDTNGTFDVFVKNMTTNAVVRASTKSGFAQHPDPQCDSFSLSGDGRYLAMSCEGSGLVPSDTNEFSDVFSKDLSTGAITLISRVANGAAGNDVSGGPMISRDGTWITFGSFSTNLTPGDANAAGDVFRATRQ
jgi:Tol biopolymer transport system component